MTPLCKFFDPSGAELGIWVLPIDPFAGDIVLVGEVKLRVIRRTIIAYEKDTPPWKDPDRIDMELTVREA